MAWFNAGLSSNSGGASSFNELDDVAINTQTLSNGQVPVYNSTTHKWENGEQSGGVSSFNELDDVSINAQTLLNGQVPIYNSTTHKWENGEQCSGHTIIDDGGTSLTQRDNLQFKGAYSEDNSANQKTVVNVVREMTKAQFDQLTNNEKTGFINITDITGGNDDRFQPVIYSSEEREIGVWKDGKPIYQKTYNATFTNIAYDTPQTVADISSIGIDTLVTLDGSCAYSTGDFTLSSNLGSYFFCYAYLTGNLTFSQTITHQTTGRTYVVEATLYYTKTTDTAGSGQWTPQGVPAHHYSTDEQVVGTWIDGSMIYEKTYDLSSNPITIVRSWVIVATDPTVSQIVNAMGLCGAVCENAIEVRVNNSNIEIERVGVNEPDTRTLTYLTIQYTKSST